MRITERRLNNRIDVRKLEESAVEKYRKCPKSITTIRHAELEEDTEFHCILLNPFRGPSLVGVGEYLRKFTIPEQQVILVVDRDYGQFNVIQVLEPEENVAYWLVISYTNRMGFLLPLDKLPRELLPK